MADAGNSRDEQGAWIFVSHSHRDLSSVREVRDLLEARGHNPLLFFLKSLGDDDEIDDLIKREIEARTWFVLCDSDNARASTWVQRELEIIKTDPDKVYEEIDLSRDLGRQISAIDALSRRATVFLSYARADQELALRFASMLRRDDFGVFLDVDDMPPGANWAQQLQSAITDALDDGYVISLLSPAAVSSPWVQRELSEAMSHPRASSALVPVIVEAPDVVAASLPRDLSVQTFDLTGQDGRRLSDVRQIDAGIAEIIQSLKHRPLR